MHIFVLRFYHNLFVLNSLLKIKSDKIISCICHHRVIDDVPNTEDEMQELQSATEQAMQVSHDVLLEYVTSFSKRFNNRH